MTMKQYQVNNRDTGSGILELLSKQDFQKTKSKNKNKNKTDKQTNKQTKNSAKLASISTGLCHLRPHKFPEKNNVHPLPY